MSPSRSQPFRFDNVWHSFQAIGGTASDEPDDNAADLVMTAPPTSQGTGNDPPGHRAQGMGNADVLLDDADVTALIAHPQRPAVIEAAPARGFWRLRAQAKVGAVRFEGFDLIIRPKAGLRNVFYLMGIERPRDWWGGNEVDLLVQRDLFAGIARMVAHAVERAIGRGVQHGYVERREPLVALRGRVDLREQLRRPGISVPAACRYDDYTADTKLNQLIRAALVPGSPATRRARGGAQDPAPPALPARGSLANRAGSGLGG